jgi:hypothetical protein
MNLQEKIYLKAGINPRNEITFEQRKKAFLIAIGLFKNEEIYLEELSIFASDFLWKEQKEGDTLDETQLKTVIDNCAEISFYLHRAEKVSFAQQAVSYLTNTLQYYENNQ